MKKTALLLGFIAFSFAQCGLLGGEEAGSAPAASSETPKPTPAPNISNPNTNASKKFTEADLHFNNKKVILTKHAKCRMDCRELDAFEIQEVIDKGKINERKTNRQATPCPSIAYEGYTRDGQQARIIVGDCDPAKIITVIDLTNDYECVCD